MKKINLFIAMSLDGYIADEKGGVDWLGGQNNDQDIGNDDMDSYSDFISDIDTVIMGGIHIIELLLNFRLINGFMII